MGACAELSRWVMAGGRMADRGPGKAAGDHHSQGPYRLRDRQPVEWHRAGVVSDCWA